MEMAPVKLAVATMVDYGDLVVVVVGGLDLVKRIVLFH